MEISTPLSVKFEKKKTPPNFCKLTPLSVKFEKNNATKFLQVNTLKCQIWKKKRHQNFAS